MTLSVRHLFAPLLAVALSLSGCSDDIEQPPPIPHPRPVNPICGNGVLENGERCDDGNRIPGDGCELNCTVTPDVTKPVCGNKVVEQGEQCDDGNTEQGDGCQNDCTFTPDAGTNPGDDGGTNPGDDGGTNPGNDGGTDPGTDGGTNPGNDGGTDPGTDGGTNPGNDGGTDPGTDGGTNPGNDGGTDPGTDGGTNPGNDGGTTGPVCGNNVVEGTEQCDDGNQVSGDGCESNCTLSPVLGCPGANIPPPATGTCTVESGDSNLLITGIILAPNQVYSGGQVLVDSAGVIQCTGCDCSSAAGAATATKLTCPKGVISPGLINAHDHITFQAAPYVSSTDERFEHRHDWREGNNGHTKVSNGGSATDAQIRWGELRQVMAGTTSVAGSGGQNGLLRNIDKASTSSSGGNQEGLGFSAAYYQTFPLRDSSGIERTSGCSYGSGVDTASDVPAAAAYLPHIAEGIEESARNEFLCTSGIEAAGNDLITPRTAVIHGIGLRAADIAMIASERASLIWSPRSNIFLYGDTAAVPLYKTLGVNIALGTDWVRSGSMNILRELRCADHLNSIYYNHAFSDEQLWALATSNAAAALQISSKVGSLAQGKVADIAIFRLNSFASSPHRAVIAANPEDVVLTLRGGKALYGDANVITGLGAANCDTLDVCGVSHMVCLKGETNETLAALTTAAGASTYKLFYCGGAPSNEPVCAPERKATDSRWPGSVNGSTSYTGGATASDIDGDGIPDATDNCPNIFNPTRPMDNGVQRDSDGDGKGDACDTCPFDATGTCKPFDPNDTDGDGIGNVTDNCPNVSNPDQADSDGDGKGNACDACAEPNPGNASCPASIYAIKTQAALVGQHVAVSSAVVTGVGTGGFFAQVQPSSASYTGPDNSGVFVFKSASGVKPGDVVDITDAVVSNYFGQIQLTGPVFVVKGGASVPAAVAVTPAEVATGGARAAALEGVLVKVSNVTVTALEPAPGAGDKAPTNEFVVDNVLRINDYLFAYTMPAVNDTFFSLTGVLEYRNNNSKIEPRSAADFVAQPVASVLASFGPPSTYVRDGFSGPTFPDALTVTLSAPATQDTDVTITSSNAVVTVANGKVTIPAGSNSAVVQVSADQTQDPGNDKAVLTATLGSVSISAAVQVLVVNQEAMLATLTPEFSETTAGEVVGFTVSLDVPAATDTVIALALNPASLGTVPATVTIPANQLSVKVDFTAAQASGQGTLTATLGAQSLVADIKVTAPVTGTDHVVISEFAPQGAAGAADEFIELYNPTNAAIDISGWKLQYKSSTGTAYNATSYALPAGSIIEPHGYFLVGSGSYSGSGATAADEKWGTTLSLGAQAAGGHVRIGKPAIGTAIADSNAVDTVGYGTGNAPEGTPIAPLPVAAGSYERKANASSTAASMDAGGADAAKGNGFDSDNNAADFIIRTARQPQNKASGTEQ
ncbi:lamin tail domain-containing protein [Myxococcaceae bacterium GXIMD 01537]